MMNDFLLKLVQAQFDLQILETNTPLVAPLPVQQPLLRQWIPGEFSAEKRGDLNITYIDQERYEIPDIVIFGG